MDFTAEEIALVLGAITAALGSIFALWRTYRIDDREARVKADQIRDQRIALLEKQVADQAGVIQDQNELIGKLTRYCGYLQFRLAKFGDNPPTFDVWVLDIDNAVKAPTPEKHSRRRDSGGGTGNAIPQTG